MTSEAIIRFGLDAVADVGEDVARAIAAEAPYESLPDFLVRCPAAGKTAATSLISAGAFDELHGRESRAALTAALPACTAVSDVGRQLTAWGHRHPLAGFHVDLGGPQWTSPERLAAEHQALGLYVSGHPVELYDPKDYLGVEGVDLGYDHEGDRLTLAGLVVSIDRKISRRGESYAVMTLEDSAASIEVLWFQRFLGALAGIESGEVVGVVGRVSVRDERISLTGYEIERLELKGPGPSTVTVDVVAFDAEAVRHELENLNGHRPVHLVLTLGVFSRTITFLIRP